MRDRNVLRCLTNCGAEIATNATSRLCYKCDAPMKFVGKELELKNKK